MSTIRLTKDHGAHKAGATISVPFGVGRELIAGGIGEYPTAAPVAPAAPVAVPTPAAERNAAEFDRLRNHHELSLKEVRDAGAAEMKAAQKAHEAEVAKLRADLDAAHKQITELQAAQKAHGTPPAKK